MKKRVVRSALILTVLMIVVVPFGFLYVLNNGNPYTNYLADKKVPKYLKEKGYTEDDIKNRIT